MTHLVFQYLVVLNVVGVLNLDGLRGMASYFTGLGVLIILALAVRGLDTIKASHCFAGSHELFMCCWVG